MPVWKFGSKQKEEEQPEEEEVEEVEVDSNGDEVEYVEEEVEVTDDGGGGVSSTCKEACAEGCLEYSRKLSECKDPGGRESLDAIICSWKANSKRSGRMCPCFRKVGCLVSKSFA